jgi:hypothetical protein
VGQFLRLADHGLLRVPWGRKVGTKKKAAEFSGLYPLSLYQITSGRRRPHLGHLHLHHHMHASLEDELH